MTCQSVSVKVRSHLQNVESYRQLVPVFDLYSTCRTVQCRKSRCLYRCDKWHWNWKLPEFLQISVYHQKLLKSFHFWPSYSRNNRVAFYGTQCIGPPHLFICPPPPLYIAGAGAAAFTTATCCTVVQLVAENWTCSISFDLLPTRQESLDLLCSTCCWCVRALSHSSLTASTVLVSTDSTHGCILVGVYTRSLCNSHVNSNKQRRSRLDSWQWARSQHEHTVTKLKWLTWKYWHQTDNRGPKPCDISLPRKSLDRRRMDQIKDGWLCFFKALTLLGARKGIRPVKPALNLCSLKRSL